VRSSSTRAALAIATVVVAYLGIPIIAWRETLATESGQIAAGVNGFLLCATMLPILAPGVAASLTTRLRDVRPLLPALVRTIALATIVSAALMFALLWSIPGTMATVVRAHVTLFAALLAWVLIGAWAAALLRNPLDAAGITVTTATTFTLGVLLLGPLTGELEPSIVRLLLLASPVVTSASAAGIDLYRTETMYQLSPLASLGFAYPSWTAACALYFAVAAIAGVGTTRAITRPR
jgi:hypothetical protein